MLKKIFSVSKRSRTAVFLVVISLLISFLFTQAVIPTTAKTTSTTLFVIPDRIAPGGVVYVSGYELPSGNSELWLNGEPGTFPLEDLIADGLGIARQAVEIPVDIPPVHEPPPG